MVSSCFSKDLLAPALVVTVEKALKSLEKHEPDRQTSYREPADNPQTPPFDLLEELADYFDDEE
jgi:hypothetical protein